MSEHKRIGDFDLWKLKKRIKNRGYTQQSFSKAVCIPEKTFYMRMEGRLDWKLNEIQRIKKKLPDVNISEIFCI